MKKQDGITLIALVITIIVLLILAGVALRMVAGNEGILTKAEIAASETEIAGAKEQAEIMLAELSAEYYEKKFVDKTETGTLVNYIKSALASEKTTSNGKFSVKVDGNNVTVTDKNGNTVVSGTLDENGKISWKERINIDWQDKFEDAIANQEKYLQEAANLGQDITKNTTIGLSADGQVVNMDLWKYQYALDNYDYYERSAESKAENGYMLNKGSYDVEGMEFLFNGAGYLGQDLENIIIPQYIKAPEDNSFIAVTALPYTFTSLDVENYPEIPKTVEDLWRTFRYCENLCNANIFPGQVIRGTFDKCDCLINVNISEGVTSIGEYAFYDCTSLSNINIPESVTSIENGAFLGCTNLSSINIPNSVTSIESQTFEECTSLSSINIPNSVTSIGGRAFYGCTSLSSVTIGNSVTSIGNNAFSDTAWYNSQPDGVVYAGKVLYKYKGTMPSNTTITVNEGTKGIADYAFYKCTSLSSINIPESVTSIGSCAFEFCTSLSSINIREGVTSMTSIGGYIGGYAFYECTSLSSINIPEGVTSIGYNAFVNCTSLSSINIPESVTSIGYGAFVNCTSLNSINIPENVTSIGKEAFWGCTNLSSINIPESVTSIGGYAFGSWTEEQTINCEILEANKPSGWDAKWDYYKNSTPRKAKINWGVSM